MNFPRLAMMAVFLLGLPASLSAQGQVRVEGTLQRYGFDEADAVGIETLELRSAAFQAAWRAGRATVTLAGAWAEGRLTDAVGDEATVSGLTDTQLVLGVAAPGGITVSAIGLLPTGLETQTLEESRVAGAIGADLFPFAVTNWGTGGGGGGMLSIARRVGEVGLGLSVSYLVRRSFEPLDATTFAYRPGDVLTVVGAMDGNPSRDTKANLRVAWHHHREDRVNGTNLYRPGDRIEATGSFAFPVGRSTSGIVYGSFHHRDGGVFLTVEESFSTQDLARLGGGLRIPLGTATLRPELQGRFFRRADGREQGWDVGGGLDLDLRTAGMVLTPGVRVHLGNLEVREGVETGLTGIEFSLAARFGGRP